MSRAKYNEIQSKHVEQIEAWIKQNPDSWDDTRTFTEYCDEYSDRFAIAALAASDMDYPEDLVNQMLAELAPFEDWFNK